MNLNFIRNLFHNIEYKRIVENFFSLSILNVVNFILPLVTLPYIVRIIGPEKYGTVSFALVIVQYITIFSLYGFTFSATRLISIYSENIDRLSKFFFSIIFIRLVITLLCLLILTIFIISYEKFNKEYLLYIGCFGIVFFDIFNPIWFFQGMQQMRFITILNIISKGIFTVFTFIFIKERGDYIFIPFLTSLGYLLAGILGFLLAIKKFNLKYFKPRRIDILYLLKDGWHIFISTLGMNLYRNGNILILGILTNDTIVGFYSGAEKIIKALQSFITPVSESLFPFFSKRFSINNERKNIEELFSVGKYYFIVLLFLSVLVLFLAKPVVNIILGDKFVSSIVDLKILSFVLLFGGLNYFFGIIGLVNLNYKKQFSQFVGIGGIISILICSTLSTLIFDAAASIAMLSGEFIISILIIRYLIKIKSSMSV